MGKISYRRVPDNWEHPRDDLGSYIPLRNGRLLLDHTVQWELYEAKWGEGLVDSGAKEGGYDWVPMKPEHKLRGIENYYGAKPTAESYTPVLIDGNLTDGAWQVYEEVTEGTPIGPVYPNFDALVAAVVEASGSPEYAARAKVVCTILKDWWYIPVKDFEVGGSHYQGNATCS